MSTLPYPLHRTSTATDLRAELERVAAERDGFRAANHRAVEWLRTVDPTRMSGQQVVDDLLRELAVTET